MTALLTKARRVVSFEVWGTSAVLALPDGEGLSGAGERLALEILRQHLDAFDLACSRFRPDSELSRLNAGPGGVAVAASALFLDAVDVAVQAARTTDGRVDPTVGTALEMVGYDRDFAAVDGEGPALHFAARPVPGWQAIRVDRRAGTVTAAPGVKLDLGATAKALCADRAAAAISHRLEAGALVSLGGDVSVAGPVPAGEWPIRVGERHDHPLDGPGPVVSIASGGMATSSTTVRCWRRGRDVLHHLIDPSTSLPASEHWRTATVVAATCTDANVASTASILLGRVATGWLTERGLPARLVRHDGAVSYTAGWPEDRDAGVTGGAP